MVDVVVIGAGAAGLAAARRLIAARREVVVLEAAPRMGGRADTIEVQGEGPPFPIDLGCGWLHSADRNVWVPIAQQLGFTLDRMRPFWERQSGGQDFSEQEQAEFRAALRALFERIDQMGALDPDAPASSLLVPGDRWNGLLNAISDYYNGAPWRDVSIRDFNAFIDTEINWRVREGYGALVATFARDVPVTLNCAVDCVEWSDKRVRMHSAQGVIEAKATVVAVPTTVLARGRLRFDPPLPDKVEAAANLPLGAVEKVFLALSEPELFPEEGHLFGRVGVEETGSYHVRPFGRPLIECFIAGELARTLDNEPDAALAAFAVEELVALIGSDIRAKLKPLARSRWLASPFVGGAYSHAKVGHAGAREILVRQAGRVFLAGEACSPRSYSTCHGAFESGVSAADAVLAAKV